MNIILTTECKNNCGYCFARDILNKKDGNEFMRIEELETILNFLKKSEVNNVRLLGGEPMLHPDIKEVFRILKNETWIQSIELFTGGIFPNKLYSELLTTDKRLHVIMNLNEKRDYSEKTYESIIKGLYLLSNNGVRITLSLTIWRDNFEWTDHLRIIKELGISTLRWSIASPSPSKSNIIFEKIKEDSFEMRLLTFLTDCSNNSVRTIVDCMLPLCIFSNEVRGILESQNPILGRSSTFGICHAPIDIGPGLMISRCFAVSEPQYNLLKYKDLKELEKEIEKNDNLLRWLNLPKDCVDCRFAQEHMCQGSCLGFRSKGENSFTLNVSEDFILNGDPEEICDYLFNLAKSDNSQLFTQIWGRIKKHPLFSKMKESLILNACEAEINHKYTESLSCWRQVLLVVEDDKKEWVKERIKVLIGTLE